MEFIRICSKTKHLYFSSHYCIYAHMKNKMKWNEMKPIKLDKHIWDNDMRICWFCVAICAYMCVYVHVCNSFHISLTYQCWVSSLWCQLKLEWPNFTGIYQRQLGMFWVRQDPEWFRECDEFLKSGVIFRWII